MFIKQDKQDMFKTICVLASGPLSTIDLSCVQPRGSTQTRTAECSEVIRVHLHLRRGALDSEWVPPCRSRPQAFTWQLSERKGLLSCLAYWMHWMCPPRSAKTFPFCCQNPNDRMPRTKGTLSEVGRPISPGYVAGTHVQVLSQVISSMALADGYISLDLFVISCSDYRGFFSGRTSCC